MLHIYVYTYISMCDMIYVELLESDMCSKICLCHYILALALPLCFVCVCVYVCVCVFTRARMCACVYAYVGACVPVCARAVV